MGISVGYLTSVMQCLIRTQPFREIITKNKERNAKLNLFSAMASMIEQYKGNELPNVEKIQTAIDKHTKNLSISRVTDAYFVLSSILRILDDECKAADTCDNPVALFRSFIVNKCKRGLSR